MDYNYLHNYTTYRVYRSGTNCTITSTDFISEPLKMSDKLDSIFHFVKFHNVISDSDFIKIVFKLNPVFPHEIIDLEYPTKSSFDNFSVPLAAYKTKKNHTFPIYIYRHLVNKNIFLECNEKFEKELELLEVIHMVKNISQDIKYLKKLLSDGLHQHDKLRKKDYLKDNPDKFIVAVDKIANYKVPDKLLSTLIFVLCYNDETEIKARQEFGKYSWSHILRIRTTKYFENIMYNEWLDANRSLWEDYNYVGTIAWKASQKIQLPNIDYARFLSDNRDIDVMVFHPIDKNLLKDTDSNHPLFSKIWNKWLSKLGFSYEDINSREIMAFYCNYWMAKPEWMLKYLNFFKKARYVLENDPELQGDLYQDSNYAGTLPIKKKIEFWGKTYYTYHVFLYERLPCFYFWKFGARLYGFKNDSLII